jgi:pimeloyl-ACP methyl ester carboxylesterase
VSESEPLDVLDPSPGLDLPESRWVETAGTWVHYREWAGPASGPTFVLVHGLGGSLVNWGLVAPGLARNGRVLALDLGGFGRTPPGDRGTTVGANWRLVDGFLGALDLPPVILVGSSMGGMVALIEAAHAPERVRGLILVDAAFPRGRSRDATPRPFISAVFLAYRTPMVGARLVDGRVRKVGPEGMVRESLRLTTSDPAAIDPRMVRELVEVARWRGGQNYATQAYLDAARSIFQAEARPKGYRRLVASIRAPALVVHGARDRLIPVGAAREAVAGHQGWELVVFDDVGHLPMIEAPARWLDAVVAWLERLDREPEPEA